MPANSNLEVVDSSQAQDVDYGSADAVWVLEFAREPSYISEIARKMMEAEVPYNYNFGGADNNVLMDSEGNIVNSEEDIETTWADITENKAVRTVSSIVNVLEEADTVVSARPDYQNKENAPEGEGQADGSPHLSFAGTGSVAEDTWRSYKIVRHEPEDGRPVGERIKDFGLDGLASEISEMVDVEIGIGDKIEVARSLSGLGNDVSKDAERIMQDCFNRQFRYYDNVEVSGYNSPGIDFYVEDEGNREWGLSIEISVRWVNPIDKPYVEQKKEKAFGVDTDLVILAPRFTKRMQEKYEQVGDSRYHEDPLEDHVHLHSVPDKSEAVFKPFSLGAEGTEEDSYGKGGNPVVVPDGKKIRERIVDYGLVGGGYPVVDSGYDRFRRLLVDSFRDFNVIPESKFRNSIREAVEPLLWEFLRPYKIEQFLIDTYWDKGLAQEEIGNLVDRSGGTVGDWMMEWGVMRRGTGAPELSDETLEIWKRMYEGLDPFPEQFSGYRIQAEYNRHPLWDLDDWREWYEETSEDQRKEAMSSSGSYRDGLDYTVMVGATDRLTPSYTFILRTLRENGVDIRDPDEAPRVPYSAYPSRDALEYMINKDENTIVEVGE